MKKFQFSAMLFYAVMLVFSACGDGEGGNDPKDPDNYGQAIEEIDGDIYTYTLPKGTVFKAMMTPDIMTTKTFPTATGDSDTANVPARFIMGETEATYQLWKEVYEWATTDAGNGKRADGGVLYNFANAGREGHDGTIDAAPTAAKHEPVTTVNWRDAIVWCNALTEYYNAYNDSAADLECVYIYSNEIIRDSRDSNATACDGAVQKKANGFRLSGSMEWEFAARYRGSDVTNSIAGSDGTRYTMGNSASGATADYSNKSATSAVAVYGVSATAAVKSKTANALGLYDMSGNAYEWCFDWSPSDGSSRVLRGGTYGKSESSVQVGYIFSETPYYENDNFGFRLCRSK